MNMKKTVYITATIVELLLILGTWVVNYFSNKKMGMMRYVVFKNARWSQNYPLETLRLLTVATIVILTIAILMLFWKRISPKSIGEKVLAAELGVLSVVYVGFNFFWSVQSVRAFYFISGMLALASVLQILKTFFLFMKKLKIGV